MSRDHKPDLENEKERILKAGGFIHAGRVNGSLNLARAIGIIQACALCLNTFIINFKVLLGANLCFLRNSIQEACDVGVFLMSLLMIIDASI